jgi:hypothetical protein
VRVLHQKLAELAGRVYLMSEMVEENREIRDPVGGTAFDFRDTARELDRILTEGFDKIRQLAGSKP